jgi:beta-lactam-binding protein with PASTA domain
LSLPQAPWVFGIALFVFSIVVAMVRTAMALRRGDLAMVSQTAGASSQDEEIESELAGLGIALTHHQSQSTSPQGR